MRPLNRNPVIVSKAFRKSRRRLPSGINSIPNATSKTVIDVIQIEVVCNPFNHVSKAGSGDAFISDEMIMVSRMIINRNRLLLPVATATP